MAQSAPVNDVSAVSKKEMNQRKLENILYCSAQSLHHAQEDLVKAKLILPSPPQADINKNIKTIINKMFHQFSKLRMQVLHQSHGIKASAARTSV